MVLKKHSFVFFLALLLAVAARANDLAETSGSEPGSNEQVVKQVEPKQPAFEAKDTQKKRDYSVPWYQQKRPEWAFDLAAAFSSGLGDRSIIGSASGESVRCLNIRGEYQPSSIQAIGVFALGAAVGVYGAPSDSGLSGSSRLLSMGVQTRYEARFIRNQWIVPTAGYFGEWVRYSVPGSSGRSLFAHGMNYGGMLLLSAFDEGSAAEIYANYGVTRVYLVGEVRNRMGRDSALSLDGKSFFLGLRFEF